MSMSYTREILNPMKVEELRRIASTLKISCSKLKKQECIDSILNTVNVVKSQKSSVLSESFLRSKTASELRKFLIDNKDKYNCCASKISGDKVGKELMINIILEKIKCPKNYLVEEVVSRSASPSISSSSSASYSPSRSPRAKYPKDDLDKMNVKQLTDIVKKMGLDSVCKVGVTKPVLIDYILKGDCPADKRKKGKEDLDILKLLKPDISYTEQELNKKTDLELKDIIRSLGLDIICNLNVSREILKKYILLRSCPEELFKTPSLPSTPPLPSPPKSLQRSPVPLPKEEPLEEESDSDVSSVDEKEEDIDAIDRQKLMEMSKALRECLGFTQKKL